MDQMAQGIRDIAFREKLRGYHPDDVDAFVEQVAAAVDELQEKVRDLEAIQARSAADAVTEETLRRTLIMAQRTADLVTSEANAAASRLMEEAQREAETLLAEANDSVQRHIDDAQQRLEADLADLEQARRLLQDEVAALQAHADRQRAALRTALFEQLALLDDEGGAQHVRVPQRRDTDHLRAVAGGAPAAVQWSAATLSPAMVASVPPPGPPRVAAAPPPPPPPRVAAAPPPPPPPPAAVPAPAMPAPGPVAALSDDDVRSDRQPAPQPWTPPGTGVDDLVARGRGVESRLPRLGEEDPFLAELRRAVDEELPEGPDDPAGGAPRAPFDLAPSFSTEGATKLGEPNGSDEVPEGGRAPGRLFRRR